MMQRVLHIRTENFQEIKRYENNFCIDDIVSFNGITAVTFSFESFYHFNEFLYQLILGTAVKRFVYNYISKNIEYVNVQEQNIIYKNVCVDIDKEKCITLISPLSASRSLLNPEGIFDFLLHSLHDEIEELCDEKSAELTNRNEYLDFIRMLRFFADINYGNSELVHVVMKGDETAEIYDKLFNIIKDDNKCDMEFSCLNEFVEYDSVISTLVEASPKAIILHNKDKFNTADICETLTDIFDDRIVFCNGCSFCSE